MAQPPIPGLTPGYGGLPLVGQGFSVVGSADESLSPSDVMALPPSFSPVAPPAGAHGVMGNTVLTGESSVVMQLVSQTLQQAQIQADQLRSIGTREDLPRPLAERR